MDVFLHKFYFTYFKKLFIFRAFFIIFIEEIRKLIIRKRPNGVVSKLTLF